MTKQTYLGIAGMCLALLSPVYAQNTGSATASSQPEAAASQLIIYHAGSLTAAFKKIEAAFMAEHPDVAIVDKFGGSVNLARQVTVGGEPADLYASADYEDIDVLLKPKWANYTIRFAQGAMVLVYKINDPNLLAKVDAIADPSVPFNLNSTPPSIPNVVHNWYTILSQPGVWIGGGDPSTDPGVYRALLIMQLAEKYYSQPGLYQALYKNDTYRDGDKTPAPPADYHFAYEHGALAIGAYRPQCAPGAPPGRDRHVGLFAGSLLQPGFTLDLGSRQRRSSRHHPWQPGYVGYYSSQQIKEHRKRNCVSPVPLDSGQRRGSSANHRPRAYSPGSRKRGRLREGS